MQKISPFLWFDDNAGQAMNAYVSLFRDAEVVNQSTIENTGPGGGETVMMGTVRLAGLEIMMMNAGPAFTITPAVSFFVKCESSAELTALWEALLDGGQALMPLDAYPFAKQFGWVQDRFGVSWQLMRTGEPQTITPALLFSGDQFGRAEEAMDLYTSLFKDSAIGDVSRTDTGAVAMAEFALAGQDFFVMESDIDHTFTFTEATSFFVSCAGQDEVDEFWEKLTADGGEPGQCGWLKDRFGISWQIVPRILGEFMGDPDREKADRVTQAMLQMTKIDSAGLEQAAEGVTA